MRCQQCCERDCVVPSSGEGGGGQHQSISRLALKRDELVILEHAILSSVKQLCDIRACKISTGESGCGFWPCVSAICGAHGATEASPGHQRWVPLPLLELAATSAASETCRGSAASDRSRGFRGSAPFALLPMSEKAGTFLSAMTPEQPARLWCWANSSVFFADAKAGKGSAQSSTLCSCHSDRFDCSIDVDPSQAERPPGRELLDSKLQAKAGVTAVQTLALAVANWRTHSQCRLTRSRSRRGAS